MILDDRHCPLRAFDRIFQINLAGTLLMIETGCFSDEHVRLDGTIRMAPI